jgi:N-acetyl-gamma-glutamyl-phosphate reductase
MQKLNIGIVGGAGYTGGELVRVLLHHAHVDIKFVHSSSSAGQLVSSVHTDLVGDTDLVFTNSFQENIDLLFLCVGHGESIKFLASNTISPKIKIIDLSQDFRLAANSKQGERNFVYGLPELNKTAIQKAHNIANPGCFATAIQIGFLPLAVKGLLKEVYTTGITGSTGAGQGLSNTSHFSWRANNIQPYKTLEHQHLYEIQESLDQLQGHQNASVHFVPWRGDFTRGIFVSSIVETSLGLAELNKLYTKFYSGHPFTHLSFSPIDLKQVVNTNKCLMHIEKKENKIVVHTAIDNLLKGAVGQAVQNMNLMMGLEETAGIQLKASNF